jgi:hypothetical protein
MPNIDEGKDNKNKRKKIISLSDFIDQNHKLISVLGIFTALTVFTSSLQVKAIGNILSFIFLALTVLVWFELWGKFPSTDTTFRLTWFESILQFAIFGIVVYWLIEYRSIWKHMLTVLLFGIIAASFSQFMKRKNIFNRLFQTEHGRLKWLRYIFGIILIVIILIISVVVASIIAPYVNGFLDKTREILIKSSS